MDPSNGRLSHAGTRYSSAFFLHSRPLQAGEILGMTVRGSAKVTGTSIGFADPEYSLPNHMGTFRHVAFVSLNDGTTVINDAMSGDGADHVAREVLQQHVPKAPFQVCLRLLASPIVASATAGSGT